MARFDYRADDARDPAVDALRDGPGRRLVWSIPIPTRCICANSRLADLIPRGSAAYRPARLRAADRAFLRSRITGLSDATNAADARHIEVGYPRPLRPSPVIKTSLSPFGARTLNSWRGRHDRPRVVRMGCAEPIRSKVRRYATTSCCSCCARRPRRVEAGGVPPMNWRSASRRRVPPSSRNFHWSDRACGAVANSSVANP